jgi:molybdopterin-guanine dinucleotide biosynthesis protein A
VIGIWPTSATAVLESLLHSEERHSMRRFAELAGARLVDAGIAIPNINTPEDLRAIVRKP